MVTQNEDINSLECVLDFIERHYRLFLGLIMLLSLFNLFYCLKETPIYSWDEARHAISAYEMLKEHDFLVNTYGYRNDYWNLKPPLSFWTIMLGYKLAGFNGLGLRLFSALSALATIIIVALFTRYKHGPISSLVAALVLAVSPKYIVIHSARTGDADALFVFFFTVSMVSLILSNQNIRWLYLSGVFFSLAFLTKSWHAFNIMLIVFAYLLISRDLFRIKFKEFVFFSISSSLAVILWGISRYSRDGLTFICAMLYYDLMSRTSTPLEGHIGDNLYYWKTIKSYYKNWLLLFLGSAFTYIAAYREKFIKDKFGVSEKKYALIMALWIILPFAVFTAAKTKIGWYILPLYPPLAICTGAACGALMRGKKRSLIVQSIILLLILKNSLYYEDVIYNHIIQFKNDMRRVTFLKFDVGRDINGYKAYIAYNNPNINYGPKSEFKDWKQSDLLSVELFWDLVPAEGGFNGFLKDKSNNTVMIIEKNKDLPGVIKKYNLKVLGESNSVYMLGK